MSLARSQRSTSPCTMRRRSSCATAKRRRRHTCAWHTHVRNECALQMRAYTQELTHPRPGGGDVVEASLMPTQRHVWIIQEQKEVLLWRPLLFLPRGMPGRYITPLIPIIIQLPHFASACSLTSQPSRFHGEGVWQLLRVHAPSSRGYLELSTLLVGHQNARALLVTKMHAPCWSPMHAPCWSPKCTRLAGHQCTRLVGHQNARALLVTNARALSVSNAASA